MVQGAEQLQAGGQLGSTVTLSLVREADNQKVSTSHVTHMNESLHTYELFGQPKGMNESCHTYE